MSRPSRATLLALALTVPAATAFAPVALGPWTAVPTEERAHFAAFASTPAQPGRLYGAGSPGGVWRSDDAGDHWTYAGTGLPHDVRFAVLAVSPRNADRAFVSGASTPGFFRSTDAGVRWSAAAHPGEGSVACVLPDPGDEGSLWAGIGSGTGRGLYRSTDLGATWSGPALAGSAVFAVAGHPADAAQLLAATDAGLSRSTDGGATWQSVFSGAAVREIDWSLAEPAQVWARPVGAPLVKSTDAGATWLCPGTGAATAMALSPTDPAVLFADVALGGCGWYGWGYAGALNRSTDGGSTWTRVLSGPCSGDFTPSVVPMTLLEVDPDAPLRVYAAWSGEGLRRSDAGGGTGTFAMHAAGVHMTPTLFVRVGAGNRWYVRAPGFGEFLRSSDAGATWTAGGASGDEVYSVDVNPAVVDLVHESGVPYTFSTCGTQSPYTDRSTNGGWSWSQCTDVYGWMYTGLIRSSPDDGQTVYAWEHHPWADPLSPARVWRSDDGWASAECIAETFPARDAAIDPRDPMRVLAVGRGPDPVRVTTDGGVTWEPRSHGLPARGAGIRLRMDLANPDHLLAAFEREGIFESTDGGATWRTVPLALASLPERAAAFLTRDEGRLPEVVDADWDVGAGERRVFVATTRGVYVEGYGYVTEGLESDLLAGVAYAPESGKLLVGTRYLGAFALDVPPLGGRMDPVAVRNAAPAVTAGTTPQGVTLAPNPFDPSTTITFAVPRAAAPVRIDVFDVGGRRLVTLVDEPRPSGAASVTWDGRDGSGRRAPPGVYFVRIDVDGHRESRRVVRIR